MNKLKKFKSVEEFKNFLRTTAVLPNDMYRPIDFRNLNSLKQSVLQFGIQRAIVLGKTTIFGSNQHYILDGNHLKEVILSIDDDKLKGCMNVIVNDCISAREMIKISAAMNNINKRWTLRDYAKIWAKNGNSHYESLLSMSKTHKVPLNALIIMLSKKDVGNSIFKDGRFQIVAMKRTLKIIGIWEKAIELGLQRNSASIRSLIDLYALPTFDTSKYLKLVKEKASELKECKSIETYYLTLIH